MPRIESRRRAYTEEVFKEWTPSDECPPSITGDDYYGPYEVVDTSFDAQGNWTCNHSYYFEPQIRSWHTIFRDGGHYFQFPDGTQGYYHPQRLDSGWLRDNKSAPKMVWECPYSPCATEFNRPPLWWLTENHIRLPGAPGYEPPGNMGRQYERPESYEASFESHSQYYQPEYMDDPYPTDPELSYDEPDYEADMCPLGWRSPPSNITNNTSSSGWRQEDHCFGALGPADATPQEAVRPRPKQTARKSSARKPTLKAQTTRKQTARKSQPTGQNTKPTPTPKPKPRAKSKTLGAQKKAPAKEKSIMQAGKSQSAQRNTILEFNKNDDKIQCRLEFRPSDPSN